MAEKQWNDKLRQSMADYSQTPPDGLWEAIDAKVNKPAAPVFQWWWALAGAAAAVAAVLMLWPRTVAEPSVKQEVSQVVVDSDSLNVPPPVEDGQAAEGQPSEGTPEARPAKAPVAVEAAPVRPLLAKAKDGGSEPKVDVTANTGTGEAAVQPEEQKAQPVDIEQKPTPADAEQKPAPVDTEQKAAPVDEIAVDQLDTEGTKPRYAQVERRTPAVAFVGSGVPGGPVSSTITEYAMSAAAGYNGSRAASPIASLLSRNKSTTTTSNHKMAFRVGVMLNLPLTRHFSIESGLLYTMLTADITSTSGSIETVNQKNMRYLGIPLQAVYTPLSTRHFSCYLSAGPMVEFNMVTDWQTSGKIGKTGTGRDSGLEWFKESLWSVGANAGVQWHPYTKGAFFLQPGVSWHFPKEGAQESLYTAQPFAFTLSGGYRLFF